MIRKHTVINCKSSQSKDFLKNTKITPYWVTGIIDAGGKFSITLKSKLCYCSFEITQKDVDDTLYMLYNIQEYFNCGEIILDLKQFDKNYKTYKFVVTNIEDLCNIILPHFDKYPLITSKHLDYLDFKKVVLMCKEDLHLININREKIFSIINNMNSKRSFDERLDFNFKIDFQKLNNEWVQAFIDVRGLFCFYVQKEEVICVIAPFLKVRLKNDEIYLLELLVKYFGVGFLNSKLLNEDDFKNSRTIEFIFFYYDQIIKFVDKFEMFTYNNFDYYLWKKLINLSNKEAYNTWKGLSQMWSIKSCMYSNKKYVSRSQVNNMPYYSKIDIRFKTINSFPFKLVI